MTWRARLLGRLREGRNGDGSWGYGYRRTGSAEATALAALAFAAHGEPIEAPARWLATNQREDGGLSVYPELEGPCWPTGLALLALEEAAGGGDAWAQERGRATGWLLEARGIPLAPDPRLMGHDMELVGWSWVPGTHSWVEPTGYALLALGRRGEGNAGRAAEGVRLLRDRCLPEGGWNYGNTRVIDHVLRPFPATTGIALAALSGGDPDEGIRRSLTWLTGIAPGLGAPLSLGWAVVGLRAWDALPTDAPAWLARSADATGTLRTPEPVHDAMLLLAGAERCPLLPPRAVGTAPSDEEGAGG